MKRFEEMVGKMHEETARYTKMLVVSDTALVLTTGSGEHTTYRAKGKVLNLSPERLTFLVLRLNVYSKDGALTSSAEAKLDGRDDAQGKASNEFKSVPAGQPGPFAAEFQLPSIQEGAHWKVDVADASFSATPAGKVQLPRSNE
jgi:hypothetical protein